MRKAWIIILVMLGILIVVNLGVLDWQYFSKSKSKSKSKRISEVELTKASESVEKTASDSCPLLCQGIIKEEIQKELAKLPSLAGQSSVSPAAYPTTAVVNNKAKIVYIPLINEGTVSSSGWTDVLPSEFYFNLADYPGAKEVRFEAFLSSSNDDPGYARIYDVTNKRGVDFSDLLFNKSTFTRVESSKIVIWNGNNKYTVQMRSSNATKVQLKDAKLKIYY